MQTDKEFEDFFREHLNGLEETPPLNAWNKIQEEIKPPRTWYREMAAITLLLLISVGVYVGWNNTGKERTLPEATGVAQTTTAAPEIASATKPAQENMGQPATEISSSEVKAQTTPETEEALAAANVAAKPNAKVSEVAALSESKIKRARKPVHLSAALALAKENEQPETVGNFAEKVKPVSETAARQTSSKANPLAIVPARQPAENPNHAAKENATAGSPEMVAKNNGLLNNGSVNFPKTPEVKQAENGMVSEVKTAETTAIKSKTDSVALAAIPMPEADSALANANKPEDKVAAAEKPRPAIMFTFTPGFVARRLIANQTDEKYLHFSDNGKNTADLGYDLSAAYQHPISQKTTLDASLGYTKLRSNVTYKSSTRTLEVVPQTGGNGTPTATVKVIYTTAQEEISNEFTYGALRIGLTQDLGSFAGYSLFASSGAGVNMLLHKTGEVRSEPISGNSQTTQSTLSDNAFHNVNSHLYLNAGVKKAVLPGLEAVIAPAFTYYLNSTLRKQQGFELKPFTFGLNLGLRYQF